MEETVKSVFGGIELPKLNVVSKWYDYFDYSIKEVDDLKLSFRSFIFNHYPNLIEEWENFILSPIIKVMDSSLSNCETFIGVFLYKMSLKDIVD